MATVDVPKQITARATNAARLIHMITPNLNRTMNDRILLGGFRGDWTAEQETLLRVQLLVRGLRLRSLLRRPLHALYVYCNLSNAASAVLAFSIPPS